MISTWLPNLKFKNQLSSELEGGMQTWSEAKNHLLKLEHKVKLNIKCDLSLTSHDNTLCSNRCEFFAPEPWAIVSWVSLSFADHHGGVCPVPMWPPPFSKLGTACKNILLKVWIPGHQHPVHKRYNGELHHEQLWLLVRRLSAVQSNRSKWCWTGWNMFPKSIRRSLTQGFSIGQHLLGIAACFSQPQLYSFSSEVSWHCCSAFCQQLVSPSSLKQVPSC